MCTMCIAVLQQADCSLTPSLSPSSESTTSLANTAILPSFQGSNSSEGADAAAGTNTSYDIAVGDRFAGSLSSSSDSDWVEIQLEAGESYVFSVWGTNGSADGITDPAMSLYDENGNELEFNEDVFLAGQNYFSMIEYTASTSGTFYISVDSNYGDSGDYILQATTDVLTVEQVASQLTEYGWGIPTAINHDEQTGDTMTVNLTALTADGEQLALWALEAWSEIMGMTFSTTTSSAADIVFDDDQAGAFAGPSSLNPNTGIINQAIVNVGTQWLVDYGTTYDSYSYLTYLHEIGHALGLTHSGNYNGSATYGVDNYFQNDSHQMTVMSYFSISSAGLGDYAVAVTPMIADVYAIWGLYGEPVAVNAGDTVWGANSNVSGTLGTVMGYIFDGDAVDANIYDGGPIAMTITDTGGYDIIDLSTVSYDQQIDIREGGVSDIGGYDGNVVISLGTVIEEVIGGIGNDTVTGNDVANDLQGGSGNDALLGEGGNDDLDGGAGSDTLNGGAGHDTIDGGSGHDTLVGGAGQDHLYVWTGDDSYDGGTGQDTIDFSKLGSGISVNLSSSVAQTISAAGGSNTFSNVEHAVGSKGGDVIIATNTANTVDGFTGNDDIRGLSGDDVLIGGTGNDSLRGNNGDDVITGGNGRDLLIGGTGEDVFVFEALSDSVNGGFRDRIVAFEQGNDVIDLSDLDAILGGSDDSFTLIGNATFGTAGAGALRYFEVASGKIIVEGDIDGDNVKDFQFELTQVSGLTLTDSDFIL